MGKQTQYVEVKVAIPSKAIIRKLVDDEVRSHQNYLHENMRENNKAVKQLQDRVTRLEVKLNRLTARKTR